MRSRRAALGLAALTAAAALTGCSGVEASPVGAAGTGAAGNGANAPVGAPAGPATASGQANPGSALNLEPQSPLAVPGASMPGVTPATTTNHGTGSGISVLGVPTTAGCDPVAFEQRAGLAAGALRTYLLRPARKGALAGKSTAAAVAVQRAGQATRLATSQLTVARAALSACPATVTALRKLVEAELARLRTAGHQLTDNTVPAGPALTAIDNGLTAILREAQSHTIAVQVTVPSLVQISTS